MRLLTNSRAKAARACARLHHLRYNLGYQSTVEAHALRFGSLWHIGQEGWWGAGDEATPEARFEAALARVQADARQCEVDAFDAVKTEELLVGYTARWGDEHYETLAVEAEFRAPLVNPLTGAPSRTWELGGKIDLLIRVEGRVLLGEHKTTSEDIALGGDYWKRLRLDGQVGQYYEGARALGYQVEGCLYDVVRKPSIKPAKATPPESRKYTREGKLYANQREADETHEEYRLRLREDIAANPDRYYQRGEVVRLEAELRDYLHDIWQLARILRESEMVQRWPRNPDACIAYGRTCDFWPVCCGEASLDDRSMYQQLENTHPELAA